MGQARAITAILGAALAGTLASGCASGPAAAGQDSRLAWLAAELAQEVESLSPTDPRAQAAASDLHAIAAFADHVSAPESAVLRLDWPVPLWEADSAFVSFEAPAAPTLMAAIAPATFVAPPAPVPQTGLALGRFTDAHMAGVMWREIEALDSAALTGLEAYLATSSGGVMLVVGPVEGEEAAAERCLALTVWGLSCVPADWPSNAQPLPRSGA